MPARQDDLGQHLLKDERAIARIIDAARLRPGEAVLDAGAGKGALTRPIAELVGPRGRVWSVEVDPRMVAALERDLPPQVRVIEGDLLDVALPRPLDAMVANPPFKIAAPLIERIVEARVPRAVVVVPRELADRLLARPGTERYGKLTVRIALRARVEDGGFLTRHAFQPPPNIVCGIVRLRAREDPPEVDAAALDQVLDVAWEAKNRKAKHAFARLAPIFRADSAALMRMLDEAGWAEKRASDLPPDAFAVVATHLREHGRAPS